MFHLFSEDRHVGTVTKVEGSFMSLELPAAGDLPGNHFGQRLGQGEVGEFLIVETSGRGVFGRLIEVVRAAPARDLRGSERIARNEGRVQLLSTLDSSGKAQRGIAVYPRLGDRVFAASEESVRAVIAGGQERSAHEIDMGLLAVGNGIGVHVSAQKLFGRHTAVVGATGSGKSWTLAHLASSTSELGGRMILIDATGEFRSLGATATHLALGSTDGEPQAKLVTVPHWHMRETDRNAFITPSSGSQLPKLRAATRSLRLRHVLDRSTPAQIASSGLSPHLTVEGLFTKAGLSREAFDRAQQELATRIESPFSPFSLRHLAGQVLEECVYPADNNRLGYFGRVDGSAQGYASSLVSRIEDLVQTPEIMAVVESPAEASLVSEVHSWLKHEDGGVLRISLRNLTFSHNLREIVVNVLGHALLSMARRGDFRSNPVVIALDEAHQFFDVTIGEETTSRLDGFDLIAKEGRKYGLTVCLATQRPGDLPSGVLSQVGMLIVHRLADGRDRQRVEQAAAELDLSAMKLLPGLVPGEAIFMGVDFPVPLSVRVRRPSYPPESDGPQYECGWKPRAKN